MLQLEAPAARPSGLAAIMLVVAMHPTAGLPQPNDDRGSIIASTIINSTTEEWSTVFAMTGRAYAAPRTIYLHPPRHHPDG